MKQLISFLPKINKNYNEMFAYLTGMYLGDGCKTTSSLTIAGKQKYLNVVFINIIKKLVNTSTMSYDVRSMCARFKGCSNLVAQITQELNEPTIIYEYPSAFLAGVLDTDGCVLTDCSASVNHPQVSIEFYNTNLYYIELITTTLAKLNIPYKKLIVSKEDYNKKYSCSNIRANKDQVTIKVSSKPVVFFLGFLLKDYVLRDLVCDRLSIFLNRYWNYYSIKKLPITEYFTSINGEGLSTGVPQLFIRVYGCNMKCKGCDTQYSWTKANYNKVNNISKKYKLITIYDLLKFCSMSNINWVCLTGGEFTLYEYNLNALVSFLKCLGFKIVLQTNGTGYLHIFNLIDIVACDIKSPCIQGSIASDKNIILKLQKKDEVKTLISDENDWLFALEINKLVKQVGCSHVLQIYDDCIDENYINLNLEKIKWLVNKVVEAKLSNARISLQIHKIVWGKKRGI